MHESCLVKLGTIKFQNVHLCEILIGMKLGTEESRQNFYNGRNEKTVIRFIFKPAKK